MKGVEKWVALGDRQGHYNLIINYLNHRQNTYKYSNYVSNMTISQ